MVRSLATAGIAKSHKTTLTLRPPGNLGRQGVTEPTGETESRLLESLSLCSAKIDLSSFVRSKLGMELLRSLVRAQRLSAAATVRRICFCHVPKCAGTALSTAIAREAFSLRERVLLRNMRIDLRVCETAASFTHQPMMQFRQHLLVYHLAHPAYKYGGNHIYCPPSVVERFSDKWAFVTILRDPVKRWISEYVYNRFKTETWMKNELPIEEFIHTETARISAQTYLRYFSTYGSGSSTPTDAHVEEATANLARFAVVGTIDRLDEWIVRFREEFGVSLTLSTRNVSPNRGEAARIAEQPELVSEIERLCEADIAIYRRTLESVL